MGAAKNAKRKANVPLARKKLSTTKPDKGKAPVPSSEPADPQYIELGFKYQPRSSQLKAIPTDLASLIEKSQHSSFSIEENAEGNNISAPLQEKLEEKQLLNTSNTFVAFSRTVEPFCRSLPLILNHRLEICNEISKVLVTHDRELYCEHVLDLIPAVIETLPSMPLLTEIFPPVIKSLVSLIASNLSASIIDKSTQTLAMIYAECGKQLVETPQLVWDHVRVVLGALPKLNSNGNSSLSNDEAKMSEGRNGEMDNHPELDDDESVKTSDDEMMDEDNERSYQNNKHIFKKSPKAVKVNNRQRRLLASAFSLLVRKAAWAKGTTLKDLFTVILKDLQETSANDILCESVAIILVESSKGIDTHLHSLASTIISTYIGHHLYHPSPISRALVSILHYSRASQLSPVIDVIIESKKLDLLAIVTGVRKGERIESRQKMQIYQVAIKESANSDCIMLAYSLLFSARLEELARPNSGIELIKSIAVNQPKGLYTLARGFDKETLKNWPKEALLDPVIDVTSSDQSDEAMALLAHFSNLGFLNDSSKRIAWVKDPIKNRLKNWTLDNDENETLTMINLAALMQVSDMSDIRSCLTLSEKITETPIETHREKFKNSPANTAALLGELLSQLHQSKELQMEQYSAIAELFHWHPLVMTKLAALELPSKTIKYDFTDNFISYDATLRREALRLCSSGIIEHDCIKAAKLASEIEDITLTFQNERQKRAAIRKLALASKSFEKSSLDLQLSLSYLLGVLKLNYRPVWSEAIDVLTELSQKFPEDLWRPFSHQLLHCSKDREAIDPMISPSWPEVSDNDGHLISSNRSSLDRNTPFFGSEWTCYRYDALVSNYQRVHDWRTMMRTELSKVQMPATVLDIENYQIQLLTLLARMPALLQTYNKDIVTYFFDDFGNHETDDIELVAGRKGDRPRLEAWLKTLSTSRNPKSFYRSNDLYDFYLRLLSIGNTTFQRLALECVMSYSSKTLTRYREILFELLDTSSFRETLLRLVPILSGEEATQDELKELTPIAVRILYGITITRSDQQASRRNAVMSSLRSCSPSYLGIFIDLMISPFRRRSSIKSEVDTDNNGDDQNIEIPKKLQAGFLSLLSDVIKHWGPLVIERLPDLLNITLSICISASINSKQVEKASDSARKTRSVAFRRITDLSRILPAQTLEPFVSKLFSSIITPRLSTFTQETAQGPSSLLELLVVWASEPDLVHFLVDYDSNLIPALLRTLCIPKARPEAISRVVSLSINLFSLADSESPVNDFVSERVLQPNLPILFSSLRDVFENMEATFNARIEPGKSLILVLKTSSNRISTPSDAKRFLKVLLPFLRKPQSAIPEETKTDLLLILSDVAFVALENEDPAPSDIYSSLCPLFLNLTQRNSRIALVKVLDKVASRSRKFQRINDILGGLNAYSIKRRDEPDFDVRLETFARLNEEQYKSLLPFEWTAVVYNALSFVKDPDEMSIRNSSSFTLQKFIDIFSTELNDNEEGELNYILMTILYPNLKSLLRNRSETVRSEVLWLLARVIRSCSLEETIPLKGLLMGDDEEANFFTNVQHLQLHRRTRAINRLSDHASRGTLPESAIDTIFLPLLSNYVNDENITDSNFLKEIQGCLGNLCRGLSWYPYNRTLSIYLSSSEKACPRQKIYVRSTVAILRAFHFDIIADGDEDEADQVSVALTASVKRQLFPRLMKFLEMRVEHDESIRIPLAEGIASILFYFPDGTKEEAISSLVMALAHILRSKNLDVRDQARTTLVGISELLGPAYTPIIVKELRTALSRGPQLHVLAFTVHALLLRAHERAETVLPNVDGLLKVILPILADDLFGSPAKERENSEFRAKTPFREVKNPKSSETFRIIAEHASPNNLGRILAPLREVLRHTDSLKAMREMENVLGKIAQGIKGNRQLTPEALLELCQSLISGDAQFLQPKTEYKDKAYARNFDPTDYIVRSSAHEKPQYTQVDHFPKNKSKFEAFGLEILINAFSRDRFDLNDPGIVSRMDPLVSLVGNTLYSTDVGVVARGLRVVAILVRCPLNSVTKAAPLLLKKCISILQSAGSLDTEVSLADLRTVSIIIRHCKSANVQNNDLLELLRRVSGDLETPEVQNSIFGAIRSIVSRKLIVPEIYDLMDRICEILVRSPDVHVREICRSIFFQFLLDYPQGQGRLKLSLEFLAKNLSYVHESGRISVMEILSAIFNKFSSDILEKYFDTLFFSLVMLIVNDDSTKCREMGTALVRLLLEQVGKTHCQQAFELLQLWSRGDSTQLQEVSFFLLSSNITLSPEPPTSLAKKLVHSLSPILRESATMLKKTEEEDGDAKDTVVNWELSYRALQALEKILPHLENPVDIVPDDVWESIRTTLLAPHAWVRKTSARVIGSMFASVQAIADVPTTHPLSEASLRECAIKSCLQLRSSQLDDNGALQVIKNLVFVGKQFVNRNIEFEKTKARSVGGENIVHYQEDDEEKENEGNDDSTSSEDDKISAIEWLFNRVSRQARLAIVHRPSFYALDKENWTLNPASIVKWMAAMVNNLSVEQVQSLLPTVMDPIYRILEIPNASSDEQTVELQNVAREVQELVQGKVGTTATSEAYNSIRRTAFEKRKVRKEAAAIETVRDPTREMAKRAKKNEATARRRKRKQQSFADQKMRFGVIGGSKRRKS